MQFYRKGPALFIFTIFLAALSFPAAVCADPVTLEETNFHTTITEGGELEVLYKITFTEHEQRDRIRSIGEFIEPMTVLESWGTTGSEGSERDFDVRLEDNGNGYYAALFDLNTVSGTTYTVHIRYIVETPVISPTEYKGQEYAVFWWPTIQWDLPITKQIVQIVTPLELPQEITEAEQIKDDLVNSLGLITDTATINSNDRWVYYPTSWKGKNYLSIYIEKENLPPKGSQDLTFYFPAEYAETGAAGGNYSTEGFAAGDLIEEGEYTIPAVAVFLTVHADTNEAYNMWQETYFAIEIAEEGKRNIYRSLITTGYDLTSTQGVTAIDTVTGQELTGDLRLDVKLRKNGNSFDLITSRPVTSGEDIAVLIPYNDVYSIKFPYEKRLYNGRYKIIYPWEGAVLSKSYPVLDLFIYQPFPDGIIPLKPGEETPEDTEILRAFTVGTDTINKFETWDYISSGSPKDSVNVNTQKPTEFHGISRAWNSAEIPAIDIEFLVPYSMVRPGLFGSVQTLFSDLFRGNLQPVHRDMALRVFGNLVLFAVLFFIGNFFVLIAEIAAFGWLAGILGKFSKSIYSTKFSFQKGEEKCTYPPPGS